MNKNEAHVFKYQPAPCGKQQQERDRADIVFEEVQQKRVRWRRKTKKTRKCRKHFRSKRPEAWEVEERLRESSREEKRKARGEIKIRIMSRARIGRR